MKTSTVLAIAGAGLAAAYLLGGKGGQAVGVRTGQAAGGLVGGVASGVVEGTVSALTIQPYTWSQQQDYIPVIDEAAKAVTAAKLNPYSVDYSPLKWWEFMFPITAVRRLW